MVSVLQFSPQRSAAAKLGDDSHGSQWGRSVIATCICLYFMLRLNILFLLLLTSKPSCVSSF